MTPLLIVITAALVLGIGGRLYSNLLARLWGEDPARRMPSTLIDDGRDYVPTPTPVVFAHHFASIAGAGPIIGPVIALCFGWVPALLWVVFGGVLIGAVHDYLATYMATREGGKSVVTVARRILGDGPFVALMIFVVLALALVCATFLNSSAAALTSMVPFDRLDLAKAQTWFRVADTDEGRKVVIGGIASMSVIVITALAPLLGWMYLKKRINVWLCSGLAVIICAVSITIGLRHPVTLAPATWKLLLAGYVLLAAGLPVWLFLQSRDFINVHILYVGMLVLIATVLVGGFAGGGPVAAADPMPAFSLGLGGRALGFFWPVFFITIACGAVSGFHSLCAGGTTCKQLRREPAARQVGYGAMMLESFLAACVIAIMVAGLTKTNYLSDVHPKVLSLGTDSNWILGFAMAVGNAAHNAFGIQIAVGAVAGMILLEGFLVTTLDTAVRLIRYLLEEIWKVVLRTEQPLEPSAEVEPAGTGGVPTRVDVDEERQPATAPPSGWRGTLGAVLGHYWVNSGLAVGLTLLFAFSAGLGALWNIFATANQLLAAMVLLLGTLWLLRNGKRVWNIFVPGLAMLVTTVASLVLCFRKYVTALANLPAEGAGRQTQLMQNTTLLIAVIVLFIITAYLMAHGIKTAAALMRKRAATT